MNKFGYLVVPRLGTRRVKRLQKELAALGLETKDVLKSTDLIYRQDLKCVINFGASSLTVDSLVSAHPDIRVFNSRAAIHLSAHKLDTYRCLQTAKIPCITTSTVFDGKFPKVVKGNTGSCGNAVFLCNNVAELAAALTALGKNLPLYQPYIDTSYGRDVRVLLIGGKAAGVYLRHNTTSFKSNIAQGGKSEAISLPNMQHFIDIAERATQAVGLDLAGVDLLFNVDNEPIVCEINSNPDIGKVYEQVSGKTLYADYAKYIVDNLI